MLFVSANGQPWPFRVPVTTSLSARIESTKTPVPFFTSMAVTFPSTVAQARSSVSPERKTPL
jgi:hypothetical protein